MRCWKHQYERYEKDIADFKDLDYGKPINVLIDVDILKKYDELRDMISGLDYKLLDSDCRVRKMHIRTFHCAICFDHGYFENSLVSSIDTADIMNIHKNIVQNIIRISNI